MKTKLAMLIVFALLAMGPRNSKAGVVGLQTTSATGVQNQITSNESSGQSLLFIIFSTTGNSGNKLTSISFSSLNLAINSTALTAYLYEDSDQKATSVLTFTGSGNQLNFGDIANYSLQSGKNYELSIRTNVATSISGYQTTNGLVTNSIPDWISTASQDNGSAAFTVYAAVPEPGTMVLTGSALVAGAIGAYIKRRRKSKSQVDAAD